MSDRHVLAITSSAEVADIIMAQALADFPSSARRAAEYIDGIGWSIVISVDANAFEQWIAQP